MTNNKSIQDLKNIVQDGTIIKACNGSYEHKIRRYPNNIIMLQGKSISWSMLYDLLANGSCELDIKEDQKELFKMSGQGGQRIGSGRKKIDPAKKKVVKSVALSPAALDKLQYHLDGYGDHKPSVSKVIEYLIINFL